MSGERVPVNEIKVGDKIRARHEGDFIVKWIEEYPKTRRFRGYNGWSCIVEMRRSSTATRLTEPT